MISEMLCHAWAYGMSGTRMLAVAMSDALSANTPSSGFEEEMGLEEMVEVVAVDHPGLERALGVLKNAQEGEEKILRRVIVLCGEDEEISRLMAYYYNPFRDVGVNEQWIRTCLTKGKAIG